MSASHHVAIVGIGGIFPGSQNLHQFWQNILRNVNTSREIPEGRWPVPVDRMFSAQKGAPDKVYSMHGCFVDDFSFDPVGIDSPPLDIDPAFVSRLDPLFHLALRAASGAYSDCKGADINKARAKVIIGNIVLPSQKSSKLVMEYLGRSLDESITALTQPDSRPGVDPVSRYVAGLPGGILAKAFGFTGGSYTLDAACASSLYAVSMAIDELISGRADAVLAGGVSRPDCLYTQMGFSQLHALSPNGVSAPFDNDGNGLVVGEGAGMFMMKRLRDAVDSGDHIYGCIKGVGLSNDVDGSLLAPATEGQLRSMRLAYEAAGWNPADVDMIECHATGTPVGDLVEFQSLRELWGDSGWSQGECVLGSVKSNIGHLLTAAGSAALMKVLLSLREGILPPTANFKRFRADIDHEKSPFNVLTTPREWSRRTPSTPRRAAVSAFGFGGINAHILVEEWMGEREGGAQTGSAESPPAEAIDVAITGMDTHFGKWDSLAAFERRILSGEDNCVPSVNNNWWGAHDCKWFQDAGFKGESFRGFYIDDIELPLNKFRIPPNEFDEILPQQLLMLNVAAGAINSGGLSQENRLDTAVIIGIGLDLNTTNYHLRWLMEKKAEVLADKSGSSIDKKEIAAFTGKLKDSAGPALNASRTLGALGGVVASRVAREFRLGGPSFTVSNEECSGLRAVETAVRLIQSGKVKQAVVGAVDLTGDVRAVLSTHAVRPYSAAGMLRPFSTEADGSIPSDGAAAVILKPLQAAITSGDNIYAVIKGIGSATGGDPSAQIPSKECYTAALKSAYNEAGAGLDGIDMIEAHGSGLRGEDRMELSALFDFFKDVRGVSENNKSAGNDRCAIGSVKADIGHAGAAAGLASFVKTALCLNREIIPAIRNLGCLDDEVACAKNRFYFPRDPRYWLRNKVDGPRRAGISAFSVDGNSAHVVLEGYEPDALTADNSITGRGLRHLSEELFVIEFNNTEDLKNGIRGLQKHVLTFEDRSLETLAALWWRRNGICADNKFAFAVIAGSRSELDGRLEAAYKNVAAGNEYTALNGLRSDRVFFSDDPVGGAGEIAFVYPGSGNHYPGMGRQLLTRWPAIVKREEDGSRHLKTQFAPQLFWAEDGGVGHDDAKREIMLAQVSIGCFVTDLLKGFGVCPQAAIGYSLGESTSLLSLNVWNDRDEMMRRIMDSDLFVRDLAGEYSAARSAWGLEDGEAVNWVVGLVICPAGVVRKIIDERDKVYLLIVNTHKECVIGGDARSVADTVDALGCEYLPLSGVTIAHCEIVNHVLDDYRRFHLFDTVDRVDGIRFYSAAWERTYDVTAENVADSIVAHAVNGFHFPRLIERAYNDGVRTFIEIGPGSSCCRMIDEILSGRAHSALYAISANRNEVSSALKLFAQLISERIHVDLSLLYGADSCADTRPSTVSAEETVVVSVGGRPFKVGNVFQFNDESNEGTLRETAVHGDDHNGYEKHEFIPNMLKNGDDAIKSARASSDAGAVAHESYLAFSNNVSAMMKKNLELQLSLLSSISEGGGRGGGGGDMEAGHIFSRDETESKKVLFDRGKCLEYAIGKIGNVLGSRYAEIDGYPSRVRLPDEPMMFVDRILSIEGEPCSLKSGRIVTEHDVREGAWYLDCGRIPTSVAVEAGQADLFLSGYLGIDFETRGNAVYRLLDAVVTFHSELPLAGETIRYDIRIDSFFRHGKTYLFRFHFEATVNGMPLLSMKDGCAGFFTPEELSDGKGIVDNNRGNGEGYDKGKLFTEIVPMSVESYSDQQVNALRGGNLAGCFGALFDGLNLGRPSGIPGNAMKLVDRISCVDPDGGTFGMGFVRGELDIHKDDWFLVCHFIDDRVMPGTLMYECCLHTLRIYLLRLGWVGKQNEVACQPVPGTRSRLKCRGQVLESTGMVAYEISVKEIGYRPEPYVICDALMFADDKAIVKIEDMSIMLSGLTEEKISAVWKNRMGYNCDVRSKAIFDHEKILAFATGKPSEAFGRPYAVFDSERKIARLPGPPYQFLDRIVDIKADQWVMKADAQITAEYDVPVDAWYFDENRQEAMPFAVLLEIALQPCGWLAAYVGSALTSNIDLCFRNLGGAATLVAPVCRDSGVLATTVKMTNVSQSGGMIIQHYDFHVCGNGRTVYKGNTYFGFFTREALAQQIGIRDVAIYQPTPLELECGEAFEYPAEAPYPADKLRMIDRVELFVRDGGPKGLGFVKGVKYVDEEEWFFRAHFFEDPVCPGSLGLESFLQLLKVVAVDRWGIDSCADMEAVTLNEEHRWLYRGQIIPADHKVSVQCLVTHIDDESHIIKADGLLDVDNRVIYQMTDFTIGLTGS